MIVVAIVSVVVIVIVVIVIVVIVVIVIVIVIVIVVVCCCRLLFVWASKLTWALFTTGPVLLLLLFILSWSLEKHAITTTEQLQQ